LRVVTATRQSRGGFFDTTALGQSLKLLKPIYSQLELRLFADNSTGLGELYNLALQEARSDPAILVFVHDDVYFCDYFWPRQVREGLQVFDIIGIAGNRRRVPAQCAWNLVDEHGTWDDRSQLTGILAHGAACPPRELLIFGPPCQEVKLLDGLLLAADSQTLLSRSVGFDERFEFHFYDMDFCRQAEAAGLRMGTWAISLIHLSIGGGVGTESWKRAHSMYLDKWKS
jgi:hypothetical protein